MTEGQLTKLTREQLYNEIWEISVSGVAKKYNVPYTALLKLCKEEYIPIPPSGYWTKLNFGKTVTKTPLTESSIIEVTLPANSTPKRSKCASTLTTAPKIIADTQQSDSVVKTLEQTEISEEQPVAEVGEILQENQLTYREVTGERNTYNREKLYEEVWAKPVVEVAVKYGVSDVAIHKICKSLNVPVPPRGYWSKLRAGQKLKKTSLPASNGAKEIIGTRTFEGGKATEKSSKPLAFLPESERDKVLLAAQQIKMLADNAKLHKKIADYKSVVKEWNKKDNKSEGMQRSFKNYSNRPPFLAGVISKESLPRVYRIIDALYRQVESLGGNVNDDLSLQIRNENVHLEIAEAQDEFKHEITRQEAQALIVYEDAKLHNRWASVPQIRKYDYVFNGRLRIGIRKSRYIRDTDKITIESRLGDLLTELYEESEVVRIVREDREEAARIREENERLREERLNLYNKEVERTIALENAALDYEKACRIRAYVKTIEDASDKEPLDDKTVAWIDWAKKKADWFDPIVAREDELFGEREHEKSEDQKSLKKAGYY